MIAEVLRNLMRGPRIPDGEWASLREDVPLLRPYVGEEDARLKSLTESFVRAKSMEAAGGLELDARMVLLIAAQACVPILNLGMDYYRDFYSVVVYPADFRVHQNYMDPAGVMHEGERILVGESYHRGAVVLSWEQVREDLYRAGAGNVVIHEFAHKLDLLNGKANGMPPLHKGMSIGRWTQAFSDAFEDLARRLNSGDTLPFDAYASTGPGEFFAVASEAFFMSPRDLHSAYPDVYALMVEYYRQDPGVFRIEL